MTKEKNKSLRPESLLVHGGQSPDSSTGSRAVPIYQTTAYQFHDTDHAASLFALTEPGNIYTRLMNPTTEVLENRVSMLEGGAGALATSSGTSAILLSVLNIASAGDEIVSAENLYGGTYNLFKNTLPRMGIKVNFFAPNDFNALREKITPSTKAVYAETVGNPRLDIADIEKLAEIAHENGIPLIVDNTCVPYLLKPIDYGADIVVYSATKFLGGHGNSMGGVIVDSGRFDWSTGRFPLISDPDPSYHGMDFIRALSPSNTAYIVKARVCLMRDLGPAISPFNSFLILQGLETLHLRMERHSYNALAVASYLESNSAVEWVNYPGLESSSENARADRYLPCGAGAIIGFGIKGGHAAGKKFIDSLSMISHVANIGDTRTLAIHPASTTHQQLNREEQEAAGVNPGFIRLSIGIENSEDIIEDIDQAIQKSC